MENLYRIRWFNPDDCAAHRAVEGRMAWERVALPRPGKGAADAEPARAAA
jgi:hypothetical protein